MITISIKDIKNFLLKITFKNLELGFDNNQVKSIFGEPIQREPQKGKSYEIISYGVLQIYLLDNKVVGFSFDYQKSPYFKEIFTYIPIEQEIVLKYLHDHEIKYLEDTQLKNSNGCTFDINNGIALGFVDRKLVLFGVLKT